MTTPTPAEVEIAEVLRGCGFWATHSDRWNDAEWQAELWSTLAKAILASPALADLLARARGEALREAVDEGQQFLGDETGADMAWAYIRDRADRQEPTP